MKLKWFGVVALSTLLMVGCSEDEATNGEVKEVSSEVQKSDIPMDDSIPDGVKDGRISPNAYMEVLRLLDELPVIAQENQAYNKQMNDTSSIVSTLSFKDEYGTFLNKYDVFIKGFNLNAKTNGDFELNDHMIDIVLNTEMYIEHMRLYLKHESVDFKIDANEYLNKRQVSLEALVNSMDKYDLFIE